MAEQPSNFENPGHDYTRFDIAYWQKWERMLRFCRDRDMIISVILYITTEKVRPDAGSEDERRFFRYAAARLGAFSNITWDLGDDYNAFRTLAWAHEMGPFLLDADPYRNLATSHPLSVGKGVVDRGSDWFGFTSIQQWGRTQHALVLDEREVQRRTGRIIPQANEEYAYEDHYPRHAPPPPGDSSEVLRRVAWDISMAGGYSTAGESARRGVNITNCYAAPPARSAGGTLLLSLALATGMVMPCCCGGLGILATGLFTSRNAMRNHMPQERGQSVGVTPQLQGNSRLPFSDFQQRQEDLAKRTRKRQREIEGRVKQHQQLIEEKMRRQ